MKLNYSATIRFVNTKNETFSEIYMRKVKKQKIRSQSVKGEAVLDRLRYVLDQSGMSGRQFAEKVGLKAESATRLFNGVTGLTNPLAYSIELHFGLRSEWLLTGEGDREVPKHGDLSPLERCGLETLFFGRHFWGYLEPLVFERLRGMIYARFGARFIECDIVKPDPLTTMVEENQLAEVIKKRDSELAETEKIQKVFKNLRKEEKSCLENHDIPGQQKKVRLGYALLLAVHFGDEWESIKADCQQWKDVVEDETAKEFNKLHSHINKIRGGIDI